MTAGWKFGKPDLVLSMPEAFEVPATGSLPYKNYIVDPGFKEDRWVQLAEARPGAAAWCITSSSTSSRRGRRNLSPPTAASRSWSAGRRAIWAWCARRTRRCAFRKARALRFELHYTPNGKAVKDRSSIGITFAKKPPRYELQMN